MKVMCGFALAMLGPLAIKRRFPGLADGNFGGFNAEDRWLLRIRAGRILRARLGRRGADFVRRFFQPVQGALSGVDQGASREMRCGPLCPQAQHLPQDGVLD
jgi:hypothetical protein